ncbi:MAG: MupG family TIM beta-alpha barrel fold protein [Streptococcus sp.]|nr:MupG family TIM beta-alpha barrel fold protein [Streptococcus sp.]
MICHFFSELGIWSLRLDVGFTDFEESNMTQNPYDLKIELNISRGQHYIDLVNDFGANKNNLIGSHNFYPQSYTSLKSKVWLQNYFQIHQLLYLRD